MITVAAFFIGLLVGAAGAVVTLVSTKATDYDDYYRDCGEEDDDELDV